MSNNLTSFRRLAVAIAFTGVTAIGTVALAPAALADDTAVEQLAAVIESAPVIEQLAPVIESAPFIELPAAVELSVPGAPVAVTPPKFVVDSDGNKHKAPKACKTKHLPDVADPKAADKKCLAAPIGGSRF